MRTNRFLVVSALTLFVAVPSWAQALPRLVLESQLLAAAQDDDLLDDALEEDAPASDAVSADVPASTESSARFAGTTGFVRPQGFYTSSDLGGFIRFGGYADAEGCYRCASRITSNLQPYIGLAVGYDIWDFFALQFSYGTGFVANAAPVQGNVDSPRDYGVTFTNVSMLFNMYFDRFGLVGKLTGGAAFVGPAPYPNANVIGGNVGAGVGVRWATLLTDVTIGLDVNGYLAVIPVDGAMLTIPSLGFAPVLQYTF
jgi:hypothetical protein